MSDDDLASRLTQLRNELHARLLGESSAYRELLVLDEAIAKLTRDHRGAPATQWIGGYEYVRPKPKSQASAAIDAIVKAAKPLTTLELLNQLKAEGVSVSGKNPQINLSSSLSRDDRLRSVVFDGERAWWISDRPLPSGGLLSETADPSP